MTALTFADALTLADLESYAARARKIDEDAAIRLQASGRVLAAYVGVLPGRGLTGSGAVLGLRVLELGDDADLDVTVPVAAVLDRLARDRPRLGGARLALEVPPMSVFTAWAGISPPRSGWEQTAEVSSTALAETARVGIAEVAAAGTGLSAQVDALRGRVWSAPMPELNAPAGLAFAAYGLGFLEREGTARLYRSGVWHRLSTSAGHVLAR